MSKKIKSLSLNRDIRQPILTNFIKRNKQQHSTKNVNSEIGNGSGR